VSPGVVGIALVAAVLHAVWNALAHAVADRLVGFASIGLTYVVGGIAVLGSAYRPPPHGRSSLPRPSCTWSTPCCGG
jgi:hypothetical protein